MTYIIPRRSGDVGVLSQFVSEEASLIAVLNVRQTVIGGTMEVDDWYPHPRTETGRAILERALRLMHDLIPPNVCDESSKATIADLEPYIVEHGCGLRPARNGGIRVERDTIRVGGAAGGREVPIVYNYGYVFLNRLEKLTIGLIFFSQTRGCGISV